MDDGRSDVRALERYRGGGDIDSPRVWTGDRHEIWVVVGDSREDDLFGPGADLLLCRAILDDGVLVLGHAEPESDPMFRDLPYGADGDEH